MYLRSDMKERFIMSLAITAILLMIFASPALAACPCTNIQVKEGHEQVVLHIDNSADTEYLIVAYGTTAGALKNAIEPAVMPRSPVEHEYFVFYYDGEEEVELGDHDLLWPFDYLRVTIIGGVPSGDSDLEPNLEPPSADYHIMVKNPKIGLYDNQAGIFYLRNNLSSGPADYRFRYGPRNNDWIPVTGPFPGFFHSWMGLYSRQSGSFHLKAFLDAGPADYSFRYGPRNSNWFPITGSWAAANNLKSQAANGNGDQLPGVGLYDQQAGLFYLKHEIEPGPADLVFRFGPRNNNWLPVAGDWNDSGIYGVGLYNQQAGIFYLRNTLSSGSAEISFRFGPRNNNWLPVAGDWNENGTYGVGLYDQQTGTFYLRNSLTSGPADYSFRYGPRNNNWAPVTFWNRSLPDIEIGVPLDILERKTPFEIKR